MHRHQRLRHAALLSAVACLWSAAAAAAPAPKAEVKGPKMDPAEVMQKLDAIAEAQRSLATTVSQLHDQFAEAQRAVGELRDETRQKHDASQAVADQVLDQVEGMRREVWGLYVEDSGLKNDIAQAGKQVEGLDQSLGSFRLSAGIVVGVVLVLQFVLIGLTFRGRG